MSTPPHTSELVAVVTGGSGGIGSAICARLARDGYKVVVGAGSNLERATDIAAQLTGDDHCALPLPVTDSRALTEAAGSVADRYGKVDLLVNCAGTTEPVPHDDLDALSDAIIDRIFTTNWRGPFAAVRAFRPLLEKADMPVVVNISSIAAVTGQGSNVAYCASKAALDSMTRSLGRALAPKIRVVSVSPGWVLGEYASRFPADYIQNQTDQTPLNQLATPDDVAAAVSVAARELVLTTGSIIPVDGGRPLGVN
ncbi:MAG: SDR family oxidoreductase [Acidimicrobiales bacterium]|nr:SDR family oxidoreductase [Acidimicrobiales bacterium]